MSSPRARPKQRPRPAGLISRPARLTPDRRSYRQYCGLARALDLVGERWTLLIVRNLLLGPRRYSDLLAQLPGITTNLLAKRLSELTQAGILEKEELPPPLTATVYQLGPLGAALEPAIMELGRWGGRFLGAPRADDTLDIGWALLSLKRRYIGGLTLVAELIVDQRRFELSLSPSYLSVQERAAVRPDVSVCGSLAAIRGWLFLGKDPEQLRAASKLRVEGAPECFELLKAAFRS